MSTNILVLGLGNILLQDEGVGVHAVNAIKERYTFSPDVEIVDGGTLGLDLLRFFEGREKVLIVDAVDFGKAHGYTGILEDNEIPSVLQAKLSVHHIGLSDILFALKLKGTMPPKVRLIGIQPELTDVLGLDMTEPVRSRLDEIIDMAITTLREWGITCVLQSPQRSSP